MEKNMERKFEIPSMMESEWENSYPMFCRSGPVLPPSVCKEIHSRAEDIIQEYQVKHQGSDLIPFRNPWFIPLKREMEVIVSRLMKVETKLDWNYSTTIGVMDIVMQISENFTNRPKVFTDSFEDNWKLRQFDILEGKLIDQVANPNDADVFLLTHGTPEGGYTSLGRIEELGVEEKYVILDAASAWPSLFTERYRSKLQYLFKNSKAVVVGDFQKVFGYGIRIENITVPINFSMLAFSPQLYNERLSKAKSSSLPKSDTENEHWNHVYSRKTANSFSAMNIIYALASLKVFGDSLEDITETANVVASKLRTLHNATGEMNVVANIVSEERLAKNRLKGTFQVSGSGYNVAFENIVPVVRTEGGYKGFLQVYPVYAMLGEEKLLEMYSQVYNLFFGD